MKKYTIFLLSCICALLISCGKKDEIINADLAAHLNANIEFSETLTELSEAGAEKYYFLNPNDYSEITAYVGTKAVCDEFVIIKTAKTESVTEKLKTHLEMLRSQYSEYRPEQLHILDNAFITEYEGTVVMIISADAENAEDVYREYLKN